MLWRYFETMNISRGMKLPRSPDLTSCGYFLWRYLKGLARVMAYAQATPSQTFSIGTFFSKFHKMKLKLE